MPITLTRRIQFSAAHQYLKPSWSPEQNQAAFGDCVFVHGHSYWCDVTVAGTLDESTGMIVDLALLDRALKAEVVDRFHMRNISEHVPEFAPGGLIPTGEQLAVFIAERVQRAIGGAATVVEVVVAEDDSLRATWTLHPRNG